MELKKEKGQSLVEFSIILPLALMLLLSLIDPAIAIANHLIGKYVAFKAAREASIFIADGSDTCLQEAREAAFGFFGVPPLIMVDLNDPSAWSLEITPCPDDPFWSPTSQVDLVATLTWNQGKIFAYDFSNQSIGMEDVFQ